MRRWFDFYDSGPRHGAEDLARLIGDESWPLSPQIMPDPVNDHFKAQTGHSRDDCLEFLAAYTALHCMLNGDEKNGWRRARDRDDAGVHPEFPAHIAGMGEHTLATAALAPFRAMITQTETEPAARPTRRQDSTTDSQPPAATHGASAGEADLRRGPSPCMSGKSAFRALCPLATRLGGGGGTRSRVGPVPVMAWLAEVFLCHPGRCKVLAVREGMRLGALVMPVLWRGDQPLGAMEGSPITPGAICSLPFRS